MLSSCESGDNIHPSIYFFIYVSVHDQNFKKILRAMKDGMDWPEERLDAGKPARTLF